LEIDPGSAAVRNLATWAAEHRGVAVLEPHDALPGFGEGGHRRTDIVRLAGRTMAGVADQHFRCLAASEVEEFRCDEIVDQDDVCRL
jgi:hypothetical protein